MNKNVKLTKIMVVTIMIALDIVLSPIFRIEGMAPMSSVMNIIAGVILGPVYAVVMAVVTGIIRILMLGIPPLALTGSIFGAFGAGILYKYGRNMYWSMLGEFLGTGIVGSLISVPVMVWFTGQQQNLYWFVYTPRFVGATIIGSVIAYFVLVNLLKINSFKEIQGMFVG
ncbi:energy coupling factor transporter S component ThiW [Leuconostoc suionicum]|uniref:energy coupling factor transporter S component ThiW n=1 Tax=Leuconostoc suionicum TaxID=1511761 RepID=UPI0021A9C0EC|nr:energy coupling factor transporter S component ThiW [Leuconostoc suionicum]MCT4381707.1 energy coupling factor transporter S component ThiW [Leuconostoc suionicum]